MIGDSLPQIEDLPFHPRRVRPLHAQLVVGVERIGIQLVTFKDGGFGHQGTGIFWIRRQHRFIGRNFGFHVGRKFVVRGRRDPGLIQTPGHADTVVLLAGDGHAQGLRQGTRARRRLGDLARFHLGSFHLKANFTGRCEGVQSFAGTKQERRRTTIRLDPIAREQQIASAGIQGRFRIGAKQLAACRRQNQTYRLLFSRIR